jgi:hypothetical protein
MSGVGGSSFGTPTSRQRRLLVLCRTSEGRDANECESVINFECSQYFRYNN